MAAINGVGSRKRVILVGDSHAEVIARAYAADAQGAPVELDAVLFQDARYSPGVTWQDDACFINPAVRAHVEGALARGAVDHIAMTLGGALHFGLSAVNSPRLFDFIMPGLESMPFVPGAEIIPFDLVWRFLMQEEYGTLQPLIWARDLTDRVSCISVPPPVADSGQILAHMPFWMMDQARALGVPPAFFRYKVWHVYTEVVRSICRHIGVEMLAPPPETADEQGCLRPAYWFDALHGNTAYGAVVLNQISAHIGQAEAVVP